MLIFHTNLIDDKASFSPEYDWLMLGRELEICTGDKIINWTPDKRQRLLDGINKTKEDLDHLVISDLTHDNNCGKL